MAEVTAQQSPVLKKKSASVNDVASLPATPALAFTLDLWVLTTSPRPEGQARKISAWRLLPQWFLESPWFTLCSFLSWGGEGVLRVLSLSPLSGAPGPAILVSCPTPPTGAPTHSFQATPPSPLCFCGFWLLSTRSPS